MNKAGKLTKETLTSGVILLVIVVVMFAVYATLVPEAQTAGDELGDASMCASDGGYWNLTLESCRNNVSSETVSEAYDYNTVPLGSLFSGTGIVFLIIMAGLVVLVVTSVLPKKK